MYHELHSKKFCIDRSQRVPVLLNMSMFLTLIFFFFFKSFLFVVVIVATKKNVMLRLNLKC